MKKIKEHLAGLRDGYFIGAECAIVFFDVCNRESQKNVAQWVADLRKVAGEIPIVVAGNKVDLPNRQVKAQEGSVMMRKLKVQYYDLSVKNRLHLEMPFLWLSRRLLNDPELRLTAEEALLPKTPSAPSSTERRQAELDLARACNHCYSIMSLAVTAFPATAPCPSCPSQGPRVRTARCGSREGFVVASFSGTLIARYVSGASRHCRQKPRVKALQQATLDVEVKQRRLLAEVEVLSVSLHPLKPRDLVVLEVTDPDFPDGPPLPVVSEPLWQTGDKALLMQVGCRVPQNVARFQGLFRELAGAALARKEGAMEGPLKLAGVDSMGLLLPYSAEGLQRQKDLERLEVFQSRVALQLAYSGDGFRGSLGSDDSVEAAVRSALLQVGVVPAMHKPPFQRLSRTDAGVHARSFWLVVPLLRLQASDLQPDGRLPGSLRVVEVVRLPFRADVPSACTAREYRYYLPRSLMGPGGKEWDLSVERRLAAALKCCQGEWPFLNFTRPEYYAALEDELRSSDETERWLRELFGHRRRRRERGYPSDNRVATETILQNIPEEGRAMTIRELGQCELMPGSITPMDSTEEFLCIRMVGEGFLNSMVRTVVGSCCAVARGALPLPELREALAAERVVDLSEFVAPAAGRPVEKASRERGSGLVLHEQHLDAQKVPWMPFTGKTATDTYLREQILPRVERAWQKTRSPGPWYQPGPAVGHSGAYEKVEDLKYVGQGRGSWDREVLPTGWRCRFSSLACCFLVLVAAALAVGYAISGRAFHSAVGNLAGTFDCTAAIDSWETVWTDEKKAYCCARVGHGCAAQPYDCQAARGNWQAAWSEAKKKWCCEFEGSCGSTMQFDCSGTEADWSSDKKNWCCKEHNRGCDVAEPYDCRAGVTNWQNGWSDHKKTLGLRFAKLS
eukprot:g14824.t1